MKEDEMIIKHYESARKFIGNEDNLFATCLCGSQNYGLHTKDSDVDSKTFVIPTLEELVSYSKVSVTILGDESGGYNEVKHLGLALDQMMNSGINFLEVLYTDHYFYNPMYAKQFFELRRNRDLIAGANPISYCAPVLERQRMGIRISLKW